MALPVAVSAQRAVRHLPARGERSFSVHESGDAPVVSGDADTGLAAATRVATQLRARGWTVHSVEGDRREVRLASPAADSGGLPRLHGDLTDLRPALPKGAVARVEDDRGGDEFSGTVAELGKIAPRSADLEKGYGASWSFRGPAAGRATSGTVSLRIPSGEDLDVETIRRVAPLVRSLGWSGQATVRLFENGSQVADIALVSTDDGRLDPDAEGTYSNTVNDFSKVKRAWDASATG